MLKVSPLQQIKLSAKNLADMAELNCNDLIILSTNSDQRVQSRRSRVHSVHDRESFSERSRSANRSLVRRGNASNHRRPDSQYSPNPISEKSASSAKYQYES